MDSESVDSVQQAWLEELKRGSDLTAELVRIHKDWRLAFRQGLLMGFGGVIGATLLVSLLVWMLQPLKKLEVLKPTLDKIAQELERKPPK